MNHYLNASRHLVQEGVTGACCRLEPDDLAEKIAYCRERKPMMEVKCKTYASRYDWDMIVAQTERFYEFVRMPVA